MGIIRIHLKIYLPECSTESTFPHMSVYRNKVNCNMTVMCYSLNIKQITKIGESLMSDPEHIKQTLPGSTMQAR